MKQVVAALIVQDGKIVICQRTRHQTMPLKWEFPGGKIEPGEKLEEALRRELDEELGIRAAIGRKVAAFQHDYGDGSSTPPTPRRARAGQRGNSVELHFFLVETFEGEVQNRIFREVRWVELAELRHYDFLEADISLVRDIASGKIGLTGPSTRMKR
jgi:8-oxo-dGTP diphosphatase